VTQKRPLSTNPAELCRALFYLQDSGLKGVGRLALQVGGDMRGEMERCGNIGVIEPLLHAVSERRAL
jgi:hypothetical protein